MTWNPLKPPLKKDGTVILVGPTLRFHVNRGQCFRICRSPAFAGSGIEKSLGLVGFLGSGLCGLYV